MTDTVKYTAAEICAFRLSQRGGSMAITTWHCTTCNKNWHTHLTECPKCKAKRSGYVMDGHAVTPDTLTDEERAYAKEQRRRQRNVKPGTDEQLFTSTFPKDDV